MSIISRCQEGIWTLAASDVIDLELSKMRDAEKLGKVSDLYSIADMDNRLTVTKSIMKRAQFFQKRGLKRYDSLHLALAEAKKCDVFLTTDDGILSASGKLEIMIDVANPVAWLMEMMKNG